MRWGTVAAVAWACVCGCSSADYEAAYGKRVGAYRAAGEFAVLRPAPTIVADGRAELRLPSVLVNQLDGNEQPKRATPPFVPDFPGFAAAYEAQIDATDGRFPVVLSVGVVSTAERRKEEVAADILRQVRADEGFEKATWRKGQGLVDVGGASRTWDVLELEGPQPFAVTAADVTVEKRLPGNTQIWLSADPGQKAAVILAWRVPDDVAESLPLPRFAELTARTVRLLEP